MSSVVAVGAQDVEEELWAKKEKVKAVRRLIYKDFQLTKKQIDYCDDACIERSLKARGGNVRKAAKQLKACLAWRQSCEVDALIADEFSPELACGAAYVAGHDAEGRPIVMIKKRNFDSISWTQKRYVRFLVFTMEVAVASMLKGVEQWVLIIDVGYSKSSSPSSTTILGALKVLSENYPERLAKAYIVDAPSVFYYLWKGIGPFVDQATKVKVSFVFSKDYSHKEEASKGRKRASEDERLSSLRRLLETPLGGFRKSDRSTLSGPVDLNGPSIVGSAHPRSMSFSATPSAVSPAVQVQEFSSFRAERNFWPALIGGNKTRKLAASDGHSCRFSSSKRFEQTLSGEDSKERRGYSFKPYWKFFIAPYNQAAYRATMKPPLGGLKSIITSSMKDYPT